MRQPFIHRPSWARLALGRPLAALGALAVALALGMAPAAVQGATPVYGFEVKHTYPHDDHAFTEGLFYLNGALFESTGGEGRSFLRRVRPQDGAVLQSVTLEPGLFGEGIVNWGSEIISLTWRNQVGFRWDLKSFARRKTFHYKGEGWALTQNGKAIILSDGTSSLHFLDPVTLRETRRLPVTADGRPVANLNELEWVKGEILANIWQTSRIARIDPRTGVVKGWIDLSALPEVQAQQDPDSVLNGIAYDREHDRLFVTGKNWPHLYEIRLTAPAGGTP
ncbi:MAG: glutaminyl-peptide cyclotransferase [Caulobacteraceae bacterium]|nr:glutaminyl-peptide cyclotransferase [Caulobacteraceae bacterium]